jgi:adenosylmethionine-8-amino-7-oxononanoate aminotransferase
MTGKPDASTPPVRRLFAARQALPTLPYSHAEGSWIHTSDGRRMLDASSGLICVNVGHAHPRVVRAMAEQAARCTFASPGVLEPALQERFVTAVTRAVGRPDDRVLLTSTGTAAIEMAVLVARAAQRARGEHGRHRILTSTLSYHGNSALALGLSGHRRRRPHPHDGFGLAPAFDPPYPGLHINCRFGACRAECVEDVVRAIDEAGAHEVAAVLLEPINGTTGGGFCPPDGYLAMLREACDARGVLIIHDEVLTGLGRTGRPLAADHWPGASADLTVLSKGLGAGYTPIAALLIEPALAEQMLSWSGALPVMGTMSATPLQAAVGLEVLAILDEIGALRTDVTRGGALGEALCASVSGVPAVKTIRGRGYFYGVELSDGTLLETLETAREHGLLLYPFNGFHGDGGGEGVIVAPPLTVSPDEIGFLAAALRKTLLAVAERHT